MTIEKKEISTQIVPKKRRRPDILVIDLETIYIYKYTNGIVSRCNHLPLCRNRRRLHFIQQVKGEQNENQLPATPFVPCVAGYLISPNSRTYVSWSAWRSPLQQ
jgi:hypothetical protein